MMSGDTGKSINLVELTSSGCTSHGSPGPELFYSVILTGGKYYTVTLAPSSSFDSMLYVFSDCMDPEDSCLGGNDVIGDGQEEVVYVAPSSTAKYYIGVDSYAPSSSGAFTVVVQEYTPPKNDVCIGATAMNWSGGKATINDDTSTANNSVQLKSIYCDLTQTNGGDLFYSASLTPGKTYRATLAPAPGYNTALYVFTDCGNVPGSYIGGVDGGLSGTTETLTFKATGAKCLIGVDSKHSVGTSKSHGSFSFTMEEVNSAGLGDMCSNPEKMQWSGTTAAVVGDTSKATNSVTLHGSCCTGGVTKGKDLFYSADLTAGKGYKIEITPSSSFDPAIYVFTDCAKVSSSCLGGADSEYSGKEEKISLIAGATGAHIIGVDSYASSGAGSFTLKIKELTGIPGHSSCYQPKTLSWSSGKATIADDTTTAVNQYSVLDCGNKNGPWLGPQLYYKVQLTAGNTYLARLMLADFDAALYAFPASTICSDLTIDAACATHSSDVRYFSNEQINITPKSTGDWIFAVDSRKPSVYGKFTLVVREDKGAPTFAAPFSWDFESNCQDLDATGDWECGKLSFTKGPNCSTSVTPPAAGHSGTGMWGTMINDCYSPLNNAHGSSPTVCTNTDTSDDSILQFKVTLPSNWTSAALTYYAWEDLYTYHDWGEVYINGQMVSQLCSPSYCAPTAWVKRSIDISSHVGSTVEVALHFMATGYNNYAGWYIDDLAVSGK